MKLSVFSYSINLSDKMEHEVLPSFKDRSAITFWISADYTVESVLDNSVKDAQISSSGNYYVNAHNGETSGSENGEMLSNIALGSEANHKLLDPDKQQQQHGSRHIKTRRPLTIPVDDLPFSLTHDYWDKKTIFISIASYCDSECGPTIYDMITQSSVPSRLSVGVVLQEPMKGPWNWEGEGPLSADFQSFSSSTPVTPSTSQCQSQLPSSFSNDNSCTKDVMSKGYANALRNNIRVACIPSDQANGPCWARGVAFSLWRGEHYYLQIDSHMRFRPNWDRYLIWLLEKTREDTTTSNQCSRVRMKPVLSTYPLGYELPDTYTANSIDTDTDKNKLHRSEDIRPTLLVRTELLI